jgi:hypothetical protein
MTLFRAQEMRASLRCRRWSVLTKDRLEGPPDIEPLRWAELRSRTRSLRSLRPMPDRLYPCACAVCAGHPLAGTGKLWLVLSKEATTLW